MKLSRTSCFFAVWLVVAMNSAKAHVSAQHEDDDYFVLKRTEASVRMPKGISDHTATLGDDNLIYLAGGCDDENGNTYIQELEFFVCGSISSSFYSFNPNTAEFNTDLPDMPRQRYRHAAVSHSNQIWLLGGRDVNDTLIPEVDVYDIASGEWNTYQLQQELVVSDLAAFATETEAVFVGGYDDNNYTSHSIVFGIDIAATNEEGVLAAREKASLTQARGDCTAVVDMAGEYAYVSGGFTHENGFCNPLETVERYNINQDSWETVAPLPTARADKALVYFKEHVIALGGERQPENICNVEQPEVGELTVPVDDVEILSHDGGEWTVLESLPDHRFRFAAVVYEDSIYTFGGQQEYDSNCQCHKTTDEVVVYEADEDSQANVDDSNETNENTTTDPSSALRLLGIAFSFMASCASLLVAL